MDMKKIALDGDFGFTEEQMARLKAVGQVEKLDNATMVVNALAGTTIFLFFIQIPSPGAVCPAMVKLPFLI